MFFASLDPVNGLETCPRSCIITVYLVCLLVSSIKIIALPCRQRQTRIGCVFIVIQFSQEKDVHFDTRNGAFYRYIEESHPQKVSKLK